MTGYMYLPYMAKRSETRPESYILYVEIERVGILLPP